RSPTPRFGPSRQLYLRGPLMQGHDSYPHSGTSSRPRDRKTLNPLRAADAALQRRFCSLVCSPVLQGDTGAGLGLAGTCLNTGGAYLGGPGTAGSSLWISQTEARALST